MSWSELDLAEEAADVLGLAGVEDGDGEVGLVSERLTRDAYRCEGGLHPLPTNSYRLLKLFLGRQHVGDLAQRDGARGQAWTPPGAEATQGTAPEPPPDQTPDTTPRRRVW